MENLDFLYSTACILSINIVSYLERFEYQDNQSTGKVGQISRECHTNSNTGRGKNGCKAGCFYS